jgi:Family of unknown function (DUF6279)
VFLLLSKIIRQRCLALALLGALALTGCSMVKLGYEQAPSLTYWWLDGHLDFSDAQTPQVRDALEDLHRWHRQHELLPYAALLARTATLAEGALDPTQACQLTRDAQQRLDMLMHEVVHTAAPMAAQLQIPQIRHLSAHLEQTNAKWEKEWLQGSPAVRQQRRLDKLVDRYNDFYGALTPAQMGLLRRQVEQSAWSPEWGRQERLRQQRDLLDVLMRIEQEHPPARQTEAALLGIWERWTRPPADVDRQRWQTWIDQGCRNLAELHNSTSTEQRQRAARRLRAYEKDLRELAGRP